MEKPLVTRDISPRYLHTIDTRANPLQRLDDRLVLRGIASRRDTYESNDKPVWRGDHTFSADAARYSLENFVEPEVKSEHPTWSVEKVHEEAMQRFERRLTQDLLYERKEASHIESSVRWKPIETKDGVWELATEYGGNMVTINELWEHTKEYAVFVGNPDAYNASEHRAQLAMQEAFISGKQTGFVSVLSHPDSVRYVQIWEKDTGGEVVSKQVDLYKATGRDLSHEEGRALIDHLSKVYSESRTIPSTEQTTEYAHFFVEHGTIQEQDIRLIARAHAVHTDIAVSRAVMTHQVRPRDIQPEALRTRGEGVPRFIESLHRAIDKKIQSFEAFQKNPAVSLEEKKKKQNKSSPGRRRAEKNIRGVEILEARSNPSDMIPSLLSEWILSRHFVHHVTEVPVGAQAALYWFSIMSEMSGTTLSKRKEGIKKTITRSERSKPNRVNTLLMPVYRGVLSAIRLSPERNRAIQSKERKSSGRAFRAVRPEEKKRVLGIQDIFAALGIRSEGKANTIKHQETAAVSPNMVMRLIEVMEAVSVLIGMNRATSPESIIRKRSERYMVEAHRRLPIISKEKLTPVGNVAFAWIFWLLISTGASKSKKDGMSISEKKRVDTGKPEENGRPQEASPWILLSIIWYLAMIREAGLTGHYIPPASNTKKLTGTTTRQANISLFPVSFPTTGVIFTRHFVIE